MTSEYKGVDFAKLFVAAVALPEKRMALKVSNGWSDSDLERIAAGVKGIKVSEIASVIRILDLVAMKPEIADWLSYGNSIGATCSARMNMGECGRQG